MVRGGQAALAVHEPSLLHPKSNPAMFTPANLSLPVPVPTGGGALVVGGVVVVGMEVVAVPGIHWE